jgi:hypothetical protein
MDVGLEREARITVNVAPCHIQCQTRSPHREMEKWTNLTEANNPIESSFHLQHPNAPSQPLYTLPSSVTFHHAF